MPCNAAVVVFLILSVRVIKRLNLGTLSYLRVVYLILSFSLFTVAFALQITVALLTDEQTELKKIVQLTYVFALWLGYLNLLMILYQIGNLQIAFQPSPGQQQQLDADNDYSFDHMSSAINSESELPCADNMGSVAEFDQLFKQRALSSQSARSDISVVRRSTKVLIEPGVPLELINYLNNSTRTQLSIALNK